MKVKIFQIFAIILLFCASSFAQVKLRNLLSSKFSVDRLKADLINQTDWKPFPKTNDEWQAKLSPELQKYLVEAGEKVLSQEIPQMPATLILEYVRNGNRSNLEKQSFARRKNLMNLVLAESIENKGRFSDKIADYVWAICEETFWGVPAHLAVQKSGSGLPDSEDRIVDLFTAETAATLALTDYFVGEKLDKVSPLLRKRIYSETVSKLFEPIKDQKRYSWLNPNRQVNNWNPWIISNALTASLLIEKNELKRAENADLYLKYLDIYLNGLGEDGGCDEGPSYWFAAGASVFDSLELLDNATNGKIGIYDEPLIGKMASYIYKTHIGGDYFVDFADADPRVKGDGFMIYRFGKAIKDKVLQDFGVYFMNANPKFTGETFHELGFFRTRQIFDLLTVKEISAEKNDYQPTAEAWFSDIQVMTARSNSGLFLATHAGHNAESHNHNDVGDFIVYYKNEPIIIDAGRGNYTAKTFSSKRYELWFVQSEYHNLPIINGFGQKDGKQFAAKDVIYNEKESALQMNLAATYPKEARVNFWKRSVNLNRKNESVEISDAYSLAKNQSTLQQIFMTVCDVDFAISGKIRLRTPSGKIASISYNPKIWSVSFDKPSTDGEEYSSFKAKWDERQITRIICTAKRAKAKNTVKYSIRMTN